MFKFVKVLIESIKKFFSGMFKKKTPSGGQK